MKGGSDGITVVFTPDNEPYLGRTMLLHFDQLICTAMEKNAITAPKSHGRRLTDHQKMACQVIPQALSIMLSIRELIRQGYLFGAQVLVRALAERAIILLYLQQYPNDIEHWNSGWNLRDGAPSLSKMVEATQRYMQSDPLVSGHVLTEHWNSLLHAKPSSAPWNLVPLGEDRVGYAVSKILNDPKLCDKICADVNPWIVVVLAMMVAYFPDE